MRPITDETLAQILARAAALLELASERERHLADSRVYPPQYEDAAAACLRAASVLRGRT